MQHRARPSPAALDLDDLVDHVVGSTELSPPDARRVIGDVLAYFTATTEDYVRRRHAELRLRGGRNDDIFARIQQELKHWPVRAPELSTRQLRRIVYG
ncbi:MAG: hypothetical protein ACRDVZ_07120 [Jiangellaceae bacterium]